MALVIADASIKNDIATSISHIHSSNRPLVKTVHHASFITSTETELFAIRCGINQACVINNVSKIVVVTDSIHAAKKIFDCGSHPYQIHSATILSELHNFGNVLANSDGDFTQTLIRTPNPSQLRLLTQPKYPGIIAKKSIAIIQSIFGK